MVGDRQAGGVVSPGEPPGVASAPEALFHANLHVIEAVIRQVAFRNGLSPEERDDFASEVHLHLIENDYEVLRSFQRRSTLRTFLVTVVQHQFLDFRNKKWGKWRPSAEARRLGAIATRLECLVCRDNLPFDEAVGVLQINERVTLSRDELWALLERLPKRTPRRFVGEEAVGDMPADGASTEDVLLAREQAEAARRAQEALGKTLLTLPPQDQLIVRLKYTDLMTVADIARLLGLEQKRLYVHLEAIRQQLRVSLKAQGITAEDALGATLEDEPEEGDRE